MNRGSQIAIGIILLLLSFLFLVMALIPGEKGFSASRLMGAMVAGVLGFACVFTWGRPLTARVGLGLLSISMIAIIGYILISDGLVLSPILFATSVAVMSGAYAVTGYYPDTLPMAQVFAAKPPRLTRQGSEVES